MGTPPDSSAAGTPAGFLDKEREPTDEAMEAVVGTRSPLWRELREHLHRNYDFVPEMTYFTKKYGWSLRYRKSGRTLCYLFPEVEAVFVLLVLGGKEVGRAYEIREQLNEKVRSTPENTEQLHDGRWLWIRVRDAGDLDSVKKLLGAKRKPSGGQGR